jgi:hypothetical protein
MNITFIGNCQTLALCFYFQQLLNSKNYHIHWLLYGEEFRQHIGTWSAKCNNRITDYNTSIQIIKDSDIIIYQNIDENRSPFCNTNTLKMTSKGSCKLIQISSIYLIYDDFNNSIKELIHRENIYNVDIKVSSIFNNFKYRNMMLTYNHPNTFLFMEIVKILCNFLGLDFFTEAQYNNFLKKDNYVELP